ncbi:MAG TPA: hypothetical protein VMZ25_01595 [Terriglobales bacterium]|nr:hypothetical protein [Terriglobales bacterium]
MVKKKHNPTGEEYALLVNPSMSALSAMQHGFAAQGIRCVVARDLPTALLALSQHFFTLALISSSIAEEGDGWALGGVMRLLFPDAFIGVMSSETSVLTLQAAINNGLNRIYDSATPPEGLVSAFLNDRKNPEFTASVH